MGLLHDGEWESDATRDRYDHDVFDAVAGPGTGRRWRGRRAT